MEDNNSYKKMYTSNCNLIRINNYKIKIQHNLSHNKTNSKVKRLLVEGGARPDIGEEKRKQLEAEGKRIVDREHVSSLQGIKRRPKELRS